MFNTDYLICDSRCLFKRYSPVFSSEFTHCFTEQLPVFGCAQSVFCHCTDTSRSSIFIDSINVQSNDDTLHCPLAEVGNQLFLESAGLAQRFKENFLIQFIQSVGIDPVMRFLSVLILVHVAPDS